MTNPLVSIIIPTKNSEKTIGQCLMSIRDQTYPHIEIVIVDNYSKDTTLETAKKYTNKIFLKGPERCSQLNFAVTNAGGKYIYRVDSDFVLEKTIVEQAVKKCQEHLCDAVVTHATIDSNLGFWSKVRKLEKDIIIANQIKVAARFVKKDVFLSLGGFDESLIEGEDYDLHNRILRAGYKVEKINAEEYHIDEPTSLWEIAKKNYYYGKTVRSFIKKNPDLGWKQISPLSLFPIHNSQQFIRHPLIGIGFLVYECVKYGSSAAGFLLHKK